MEPLTITETAMRRSLLALVLAVCTISAPASANYIRNGDFSQENLYWTDLGTGFFQQAYYEGASRFVDGWIEQSFTDNGGPLWLEYDFEALYDGYGYATWNGVLIPGSYYSGEMTHLVFKVMGTGQDTLRVWGLSLIHI